jgi:CRISPR/Cas system CSM-associated protein Csm5 (group 7 of RAMP superfamily)
MSGGTRSVGVSKGAKVAKGKKSSTGASAAKWKKTPDYRNDDFSSSSDDSTQKATKGKHSIKDLLEKIKEKDKMIRSLDLRLANAKVTSRMNKTKVQEELKWTGEETTFAETVNNFCRIFLFPKFKFLKYG